MKLLVTVLKDSPSRKGKVWKSIRFPARIIDMVYDMQSLLGDGNTDFTEALMYILIDWEKNRYYQEKLRLLELSKIRFAILENISVKE